MVRNSITGNYVNVILNLKKVYDRVLRALSSGISKHAQYHRLPFLVLTAFKEIFPTGSHFTTMSLLITRRITEKNRRPALATSWPTEFNSERQIRTYRVSG